MQPALRKLANNATAPGSATRGDARRELGAEVTSLLPNAVSAHFY